MSYNSGDKVKIIVGGPHEHIDREATLSYPYTGGVEGDWVLYFGDQDEDEFVYSENEFEKL